MVARKVVVVVGAAAVVCCLSWVLCRERLGISVLRSYSSIHVLDGGRDEE